MASPPGILSQIASLFSPVHRDGHKFLLASAAATVVLFLVWSGLGLLGLAVTLAIAFCFRDPERVTPVMPRTVLAAADGVVLVSDSAVPPVELGLGEALMKRMAIFITIFDVHVIRSPLDGTVTLSQPVEGSSNAFTGERPTERTPERYGIAIDAADGGKYGVLLTAGLFARRIVPFTHLGDKIQPGTESLLSVLEAGWIRICRPTPCRLYRRGSAL